MNREAYLKLIDPAIRLQERKSSDYNKDQSVHDYFPFGHRSYAQMLHVKARRIVSLAGDEKQPAFESARDSTLDLINYAVFYLEFLEIEEKKRAAAQEQNKYMNAAPGYQPPGALGGGLRNLGDILGGGLR